MRTWLASLIVVTVLAGAAVAQDYPYDDGPDPDGYEASLAPHGTWDDIPTYGRVWRPSVAYGWAPYSDGQWVWTAYGWTWVSYEPWAWTFHYGRWALAPSYGWVWVPGRVWGPAWVDWVYDDGYVGWAPLGPFGWRAGFDDYFFVRDDQFCNPRLRSAYVPHGRLPGHVRDSWSEHRVDRVDRQRIERVTRHPVRQYGDRPAETLAPWHRRELESMDRRGSDRRRPGPDQDDHRRSDRDDDDVSITRRPAPSSGDRPAVRQPEPPLPPPVHERRHEPGTVTRAVPNAPAQRPGVQSNGSGAWHGDVRPMAPRGDGGGGGNRGGDRPARAERPASGDGQGSHEGGGSGTHAVDGRTGTSTGRSSSGSYPMGGKP
jgi:hypothetical protein